MNNFVSRAQESKFYEQLKVVDDMNDSGHELKAINALKQLYVIVNMNDSKSWAQGSRCFEQLRVVDNMNDSSS